MASASSVSAAEEAALLRQGIPKDKVDEYAAAFSLFAESRGGGAGAGHSITLESLRRMLSKFGQDFPEDDLKYMLRQFSSRAGETGEVDFAAFATSMHEKMADARFNEAFGDAFDLFDSNKSGELSKVELMTGMSMLGENLTEAEADEVRRAADERAARGSRSIALLEHAHEQDARVLWRARARMRGRSRKHAPRFHARARPRRARARAPCPHPLTELSSRPLAASSDAEDRQEEG